MYTPKHFEQNDTASIYALIEENPLATLITTSNAGLAANHIPLHLSKTPRPYGLLSGHIPRANPLAQQTSDIEGLAIFHGPNAYISPAWYGANSENTHFVPTWNYTVVHARGRIRLIDDADWLLNHLSTFTEQLETPLPTAWSVSDAPSDFISNLLPHLVGFEMIVESLEGKWKVSQNRSSHIRNSAADELEKMGSSNALAIAKLMRE